LVIFSTGIKISEFGSVLISFGITIPTIFNEGTTEAHEKWDRDQGALYEQKFLEK
jgi:hypothetical protein